MKLFEWILEGEATEPKPNWVRTETVVKGGDVAPRTIKPPADTSLFAIGEAEVVVRGESPIQRQRALDGTQHTKTGRTGLRPPEAELYLDGLSKAFPNPDVPEQTRDKEPGVRRTPDEVVKAFLES